MKHATFTFILLFSQNSYAGKSDLVLKVIHGALTPPKTVHSYPLRPRVFQTLVSPTFTQAVSPKLTQSTMEFQKFDSFSSSKMNFSNFSNPFTKMPDINVDSVDHPLAPLLKLSPCQDPEWLKRRDALIENPPFGPIFNIVYKAISKAEADSSYHPYHVIRKDTEHSDEYFVKKGWIIDEETVNIAAEHGLVRGVKVYIEEPFDVFCARFFSTFVPGEWVQWKEYPFASKDTYWGLAGTVSNNMYYFYREWFNAMLREYQRQGIPRVQWFLWQGVDDEIKDRNHKSEEYTQNQDHNPDLDTPQWRIDEMKEYDDWVNSEEYKEMTRESSEQIAEAKSTAQKLILGHEILENEDFYDFMKRVHGLSGSELRELLGPSRQFFNQTAWELYDKEHDLQHNQ